MSTITILNLQFLIMPKTTENVSLYLMILYPYFLHIIVRFILLHSVLVDEKGSK